MYEGEEALDQEEVRVIGMLMGSIGLPSHTRITLRPALPTTTIILRHLRGQLREGAI